MAIAHAQGGRVIRKIAIVSKPGREDIPELLRYILEWAAKHSIDVKIDTSTANYLQRTSGEGRDALAEGCDLVIVLGGDGTLLSAARAVGPRQTPLLAVNLGGLGFMMTIGPDELPAALDSVARSAFKLDSRMVLEAGLERHGEVVDRFFALNDIVVANGAVARLLHLEAYANGEFVCGYRSDGLVVSTPTGSTAYSLSAGGPVMAPDVAALTLTPICPHTLSNRAVVLPASAEVEVRILDGAEENFLSIDGQVGRHLEEQDRLRLWRASHTVDIVQTEDVPFFDVLRSKMRWGER